MGAASPAEQVTLTLCYNDQLGRRDEGHFSLVLMRAVQSQVPEADIRLSPVPWKRCLVRASRGDFDGILGASFTEDRALNLTYPRDERGELDASKRMFLQGYRLLRRQGTRLSWNGQRFIHIDGAIGAESGHSALAFVREQGVEVDDQHPNVYAMLAKLRAGRLSGAMVAEPLLASLMSQPGALDGLEMVEPPLVQRPYFLLFSKPFAARNAVLVQRIWTAIALQRETPEIRRITLEQQGAWSLKP